MLSVFSVGLLRASRSRAQPWPTGTADSCEFSGDFVLTTPGLAGPGAMSPIKQHFPPSRWVPALAARYDRCLIGYGYWDGQVFVIREVTSQDFDCG
jgi:hypothetical protein